MKKFLGATMLLINMSFAITIGDEIQNIGNAISNLGNALNGGAYSNTYSNQCNVPPGWQRGKKVGFQNGLPPGLAKKGLTENCTPQNPQNHVPPGRMR